jgi:hypothetical protein
VAAERIGYFDTEPTVESNSGVAHAIRPYISRLCALETRYGKFERYKEL